jgi:hypothetical protein
MFTLTLGVLPTALFVADSVLSVNSVVQKKTSHLSKLGRRLRCLLRELGG